MIPVNLLAIGGVILAALALVGTFFAGSDAARIGGHTPPLLAASVSLAIAALLMEFHA